MQGYFITFEGPDGAGKTTQLKLFAAHLEQEGYEVVVTREPGGTEISDQIRTLVLSPDNYQMVHQTEVLLYAASRAQHVHQKIIPALKEGKIVLCDRFIDASVAYQSFGLGMEESTVRSINRFAASGLQPHRTYMFDIPVEESHKRLMDRSQAALDRIEQRNLEFHRRVREGFLYIARMEPDRVRLLNAARSVPEIATEVINDFKSFLVSGKVE